MARTELLRVFSLAITGSLLLWLAWPSIDISILLFVGMVPFLFVEDLFQKKPEASGKLYLGVIYTGLLCWNALTTYWVMKATIGGGLFALVANAALMTLPFGIFHALRTRLRWPWGLAFLALVIAWIALELLHLNWQLAWPWLNLGNAFAAKTDWVQWYEYTGALGGTLWVWVVNGLIFILLNKALASTLSKKAMLTYMGLLVVGLGAPILLSSAFPESYASSKKGSVVLIQPNVDPYEDKFNKKAYDKHLNNLINLSRSAIDSKTDLVLWPETSLPGSYQESQFYREARARKVQDFVEKNPSLTLITGLNTYVTYPGKATPTARESNGNYYDVYNAAAAIDTNQTPEFYHKSILVPGVERMPYPAFLGFLESLAIEMGGTSGSLATQDEPTVMRVDSHLTVAPVICYESVFGAYVGEYVNKGANLIAVITNDGWWGDTDGYRQHFVYSKLRAIEMRKSIARAANTGISSFIRPNGEVIKTTAFWEKAAIKDTLPLHEGKTFYVRNGDFIGYGALGAGVFLLGIAFLQRFRLIPRF